MSTETPKNCAARHMSLNDHCAPVLIILFKF
nr:MAG TPA: hypothetical protein [Caudoviricetes sp.]